MKGRRSLRGNKTPQETSYQGGGESDGGRAYRKPLWWLLSVFPVLFICRTKQLLNSQYFSSSFLHSSNRRSCDVSQQLDVWT